MRWFFTALFLLAAIVIVATWWRRSSDCAAACALNGQPRSQLELTGGGRFAMSVQCRCAAAPSVK